MGVSSFPPVAGDSGSGFSNFAIDLGDYTDNTTTLSQSYPAGGYSIGSDPSDTTLDFYLLDADGALVGYSGTAAITATEAFTTVVVLGGQANLKLSFTFNGEAGVPDSAGNSINAGAYITSTTPTDLPDINDTTTVTGGNFATDVEMNFVSGEVTLAAKSVTRGSSLELVVTRPDTLDSALDPWSMQVSNPGIPVPSGSNVNKIEVTAGAVPTWVTTSPLPAANLGDAYTTTLEATDPDPDSSVSYEIIIGSFPGLTLDSATGVLSGTPTANSTATVRATDLGGNSNTREFSTAFLVAAGGTKTTAGDHTYHTFTGDGTMSFYGNVAIEFLVVGGGGGCNPNPYNPYAGGGGGAGGYLALSSTIAANDYAIVVGAGGNEANGGNTSFNGNIAIGGGRAADYNLTDAQSGGSGGGNSGNAASGGAGTSGQGFAGGGAYDAATSGGGGGAGGPGGFGGDGATQTGGDGGAGLEWLNGTYYAAGGGGGTGYGSSGNGAPGLGNENAGGGGTVNGPLTGKAGIVIVRYPTP